MLHRRQPLGVKRQVAVRRQGEAGQNPLQVELAETGSGAVAVTQQIIEPIAVKLATYQCSDRRWLSLARFQEGGYSPSQPRPGGFQTVPQVGMLQHQPRRPGLMP